MTLTSYVFLIGILPWLAGLVFLVRKKPVLKKTILIVSNCVFYIWSGVGAFIFLCIYSLTVFACCKISSIKKSKILFGLFIALLACPLAVSKYCVGVINMLNSVFGMTLKAPGMLVILGLSFFSFEAISCLSDVYTGKFTGNISFFNIFMYLSFFPTVTSGPIVRMDDFVLGLDNIPCKEEFGACVEKIVIGLGKKLLIADKLAPLANFYFDGVQKGAAFSSPGLWIGSVAYSLQLYYDFSGYSDMAIGIAGLFGFTIPENFNAPYRASGIQEFWRRWHISLSRWFRDYIYIPLGGSRCTAARNIFNLLVVWLLTGIWHGNDWSFVVWGLGYFVLLLLEKYVPFIKKMNNRPIGHIYTLFMVNLLWIPFRAADLHTAMVYITCMFKIDTSMGLEETALRFMPFAALSMLLILPWKNIFAKLLSQKDKDILLLRTIEILKGLALIVILVLSLAAIINANYAPYIYGAF